MIRKGFVWIFVLVLFRLTAMAQEMSFTAQVNAERVGTKDQFQVSYTLNNAPNAVNFKPPNFSGFSILGGPYQSNNSSVSNVNGQWKQTTSVVLTYVLNANRTGTLTIGPATVTNNGHEVSSNSVTIQAVNGSLVQQQQRRQQNPFGDDDDDPFVAMQRMQQQMMQQMSQAQQSRRQQAQQQQTQLEGLSEQNISKNIFIKVEVDKTNPHVGEQITVSYKLYTRLAMSVNLTGLPSLNGFWSQDFQTPTTPKPVDEVVNGQHYQVFLLKKTALFPQQDGALTLDAAKAEGVVRVVELVKGKNPYANDPNASFFMNDPYFNQDMFNGYNYKDVPVKLSSIPVKINVKPLPPDKQPPSFTGAVGNFTIASTLDKNALSTDDAATLTFTIKGSGNLKLISSPKITFPAELGVYEPQTADTITSRNPAITGSKIFTYNMNPQTPGDYEIPAIKFSYYDAALGSYKELSTQPIKVHVTKGKNYNPNVAKGTAALTDIHDINKSTFEAMGDSGVPVVNKWWYWVFYGLGLAALIALLLRKKQQEMYEGNQALFKNKKANKIAWKRLAEARKLLPQQQHKAFYEEISKAVWLYLSDKLGIPLSHLSKETMEGELELKQVPVAQINRVKSLVLECEMALYSPSGGQKQRQHTLDEAAGTIGELEIVLKNKKNTAQYAG
jgi:hypothetical protein